MDLYTPRIGTKILLTPAERLIGLAISDLRSRNNRDTHITSKKISVNFSDIEIDFRGFVSELAFAKLFNLYPDFTIHPRSSSTDLGDVKLPNGKTVDVKTTDRPDGRLLAPTWKNANVDYYALIIGYYPEFEFKGFMIKEELINPKRLGDLGHGLTYIAEQHELKELHELEGILDSRKYFLTA